MLKEIRKSYENGNNEKMKKLSTSFLNCISRQDKLLSTRKEFRLAPWLQDAAGWGGGREEKELYLWNGKVLLTVWANRDSGPREYSRGEWSGLLRSLYYERWKRFFQILINERSLPKALKYRYYEMEKKWTESGELYLNDDQAHPVKTAVNGFYETIEK